MGKEPCAGLCVVIVALALAAGVTACAESQPVVTRRVPTEAPTATVMARTGSPMTPTREQVAATDTPIPPADAPTAPPDTPKRPSSTPVRVTVTAEDPNQSASPAVEGDVTEANVLHVRAELQASGSWSFAVTVQHEDTGWDHYADRWEVLTPDGDVLATRVLAHPHVEEQPFTRSLGGILIPPSTAHVWVRAHDLVHGYGGHEVFVDLAQSHGQRFDVVR